MLLDRSSVLVQKARTYARRFTSTSRSLGGWCAYNRRGSSRRDQVRRRVATRRNTNRQDLSLELAVLLWLRFRRCAISSVLNPSNPAKSQRKSKLTLVILLHIEPPQQHNRLLAEQASIDRISRIDTLVHVDSHHAASAAKTVVETAKVDAADTELAKSRSAHDARFDRHVEIGGVQDGWVVVGHDLAESDEFGVAGAL
jgi:hypothetical protein